MPPAHHATVRFFDVDRAGIAFFAGVFPLCHAAWEEVMAEVLAPSSLEEGLADGRWCLPVVRAEADYHAPMRLGDRLMVLPRLQRLTERGLAVDYAIVGETCRILRASVRLTHAAALPRQLSGPGAAGPPDPGDAAGAGRGQGARIPEPLRSRLRAVLGEA